MNAQPLAFVVHVGDIGASALACSDDWLLERKAQFARIRHPFVLVPGDNEWSDCKDPLERLARWRELFCETPRAEFCEHLRWESRRLGVRRAQRPRQQQQRAACRARAAHGAVLSFLAEAARVPPRGRAASSC